MSSPRGLDAGGIGVRGTLELRRAAPRPGEGLRRRAGGEAGEADVDVDEGEGGGGVGGRAKRRAKGLKGSLERNGGWRMLRCMLKLRSDRFACGTYLDHKEEETYELLRLGDEEHTGRGR